MKKDKLRIFVIEPANGGGLIHFSYQLCNALATEGMDVTLIAGTEYELEGMPHNFEVKKILYLWKNFENRSDQDSLTRFQRLQQKVYRSLRRVVRGIRFVMAWVGLMGYLLRARPDLIQFSKFYHSTDAFFVIFLRMCGFKLGQLCHEFENRESNSFMEKLLARVNMQAYDSFSAIFLLARESQERFLQMFPSIDPKKTFVVPHGNSGWLLNIQSPLEKVQLRKRYGLSDDEKVVLFFGLLAPSKGLEDLLEAFYLVQAVHDTKLVIAGYPTKYIDLPKFNARIAEMGISDKVIMDLRYIPLDEIGALMDLARVVVYPYRSSTQSGSLQVAYTFGRPVVASAVGGLPEVVDEGKSGFLTPPQSPRDLADKILILFENPKLTEEMGEYARHLSNTKFSWQTVASQMSDAYKSVFS